MRGRLRGIAALVLAASAAHAQTPVLPADAVLSAPLGGAERTQATAEIVPVTGQPFARARRVRLAKAAANGNDTQLILNNAAPVAKGDALLATFFVRSGRVELTFEKGSPPWTKSLMHAASAPASGWRKVVVPFTAAEDYAPGQALIAVRLGYGAQTVEIGGLGVANYGKTKTLDQLNALAAEQSPLGTVAVAIDLQKTRQTMVGLGGNYAKSNWGMAEPNDAVGRYTLANLRPVHARLGVPLKNWQPQPGDAYIESGPVTGFLTLAKELSGRKIPLVASIWDVPDWMVENPSAKTQRRIPPARYGEAITAITRLLVRARDGYGVTIPYLSFNEADGGYQIKFTAAEMAAFIRQAAPRFKAAGLTTKWLAGDTSNGRALVNYARPLLEDPTVEPQLGPVSFHAWDAMGASAADYAAIAALAKQHDRTVWCLEVGWDAQLWQRNPPVWDTWDNALKLAQVYHKSIYHARASLLDYWQYQNDYPLATTDGKPYPALTVLQQLAAALPEGSAVVETTSENEAVLPLATTVAGRVTITLINSGGPGRALLTGLPANSKWTLIRSDAAAQNKPTRDVFSVSPDGKLTVPLTPRSIVTLRNALR